MNILYNGVSILLKLFKVNRFDFFSLYSHLASQVKLHLEKLFWSGKGPRPFESGEKWVVEPSQVVKSDFAQF